MIRIQRALEVSLMAWIAAGVGQLVIVIHMALHTLRNAMLAGERELRRIVVERGRLPGDRRMTLGACLWISHRHVVRADSPCKVGLVAIDAGRREPRVLVVFVAVLASGRAMRTRQGELGCDMVECRRDPETRRVTGLALMTETRQCVRRARWLCIVSLMALVTVSIGQLVVAVKVARLTLGGSVFAGQGELGAAVVERRRFPGAGRMTRFASVIQHGGCVVRV